MVDLHIKQEWKYPAAVGVLSFAAGVGVGFWLSARRIGKVVEETISFDVAREVTIEVVDDSEPGRQLYEDFQRAIAESEQPAPRWASDAPRHMKSDPEFRIKETIKDIPVGDQRENAEAEEVEEIEEFTDNWNQEEEEEDRGPDAPYTIHRDEFGTRENNFNQTTLEYYAEDDVLCDDKQTPIYNANQVVGKLEFGHGSEHPDVVYVRNEKLKTEFEVVRFTGSYQVEVLGVEIEEEAEEKDLKHSRSIPKFRLD